MPRGDGTGPAGLGPMTGRGAGYCAGFGVPGFVNPIPRGGRFGYRSFGTYYPVFWGFPRFGLGMRFPYYPYNFFVNPLFQQGFAPGYPEEQELAMLKNQAQMLSEQLEQIRSRIEVLEQGKNEINE